MTVVPCVTLASSMRDSSDMCDSSTCSSMSDSSDMCDTS